MTCPTCQIGPTSAGRTTKLLERDGTLVVVRHVPAQICDRCGAPLFAAEIVEQLLAVLEEARRSGVTVQVREFAGAAQPAVTGAPRS